MRHTSGTCSCPTEGVEMTGKKNGIPELLIQRRAFRDDCAEEERTHPCKYQRRKGRPPPIYKIQITRQVERACIAPTALGALGMVYPALTGWAKGCRASGAFWGMGEAR